MSERSAQILALLAEGRTCRAIADRLGISPQRVSQVAALHGRPIHEFARRRGLVEQAGCANDRDQPAVTALHWVSVAAILAPLVPLIALIVQLCRAPIGR